LNWKTHAAEPDNDAELLEHNSLVELIRVNHFQILQVREGQIVFGD
jgi:hypothetical protein